MFYKSLPDTLELQYYPRKSIFLVIFSIIYQGISIQVTERTRSLCLTKCISHKIVDEIHFNLDCIVRPFEQGGMFIVPHLLRHGTSFFAVSSEGLFTYSHLPWQANGTYDLYQYPHGEFVIEPKEEKDKLIKKKKRFHNLKFPQVLLLVLITKEIVFVAITLSVLVSEIIRFWHKCIYMYLERPDGKECGSLVSCKQHVV